MIGSDKTKHWEGIYSAKKLTEVSWYQAKPETSLGLIESVNPPKSAAIIDIGGGDSLLIDHLLEMGFSDLTVLDISETALKRAKERLGEKSADVNWIASDVAQFSSPKQFDVWHDRAAFHFLTSEEDKSAYIKNASSQIKKGGHLILGTFSENGPKKCSGIEIKQYSIKSLSELFADAFKLIDGFNIDHTTPTGAVQNFVFCVMRRK